MFRLGGGVARAAAIIAYKINILLNFFYCASSVAFYRKTGAFYDEKVLSYHSLFGNCAPAVIKPVLVDFGEGISNCVHLRSFERRGEFNDIEPECLGIVAGSFKLNGRHFDAPIVPARPQPLDLNDAFLTIWPPRSDVEAWLASRTVGRRSA